MRSTFYSFLFAMSLAAGLGAAGGAHAQDWGGQGQGPAQQNAGNRGMPRAAFGRPEPRSDNNHNSLSDSVRRIQREPGVRVLSAERVPFDGRDINRIKYVDEHGRVRYMDDAGGSRRRSSTPPDPSPPPGMQPPARGDNPYQP